LGLKPDANPHRYVRNATLVRRDPSGLESIPFVLGDHPSSGTTPTTFNPNPTDILSQIQPNVITAPPLPPAPYFPNGVTTIWPSITGGTTPISSSSATIIDVAIAAFIPGRLGYQYQIGPYSSNWLEEPGEWATDWIPFYTSGKWYVKGDNRTFNESLGDSRLYSRFSILSTDIGKLNGQVWDYTLTGLSVRTRIGSNGAPIQSGHGPRASYASAASSGNQTTVTLLASGAYPFNPVAPDIDYLLSITFSLSGVVATVSGSYTHDSFPDYEVRVSVRGRTEWAGFMTSFSGPSVLNLNLPTQDSFGPWAFDV
jgi:hypothetical protein